MIRSLKEIRNKDCTDCGLCEKAEYVCLTGYGKVPSNIMIVGEAPGQRENDSGKSFVGKSGRLLDNILEALELDRDKVYITNAVHCRPPENRAPKMDEIRACRKYLIKEIDAINPKTIIALGTTSLKSIFDSNLMSITRERGKVLKFGNINVIPTYHPAAALRKPYFAKIMYQDLKEGFKRIENVKAGDIVKGKREYILVTDDNRESCRKDLLNSEALVCDLETQGLDAYDKTKSIICIGLANKKDKSYIFPNTKVNLEVVKDIFWSTKLLVNHNIKFDMKWLMAAGVEIKIPIFDTLVAMHLIDENYPNKSLEHLTLKFFPDLGEYLSKWKQILKEKYKLKKDVEMSMEDWTAYCGGDCDATFQLYEYLKSRLEKDGLLELMDFEMKNLKVLSQMEKDGFQIDLDMYKKLKIKYEDELQKGERNLKAVFGDININSPKQVANKLFTEWRLPVLKESPGGSPSCDEATLNDLIHETKDKEKKKAIQLLLSHRYLNKIYGTYILGLTENNILKPDGKIHCDYKITGTVTGRLSCSDPNLQNIPRTGDIKAMFVSSYHNGVLVQGDYSQAELRLLAHHSNDLALIQAFKSGRDIHKEVAAKVFKKKYDLVTEEERKFAKQVNFGIVYLISARGLAIKLGCSEARAGTLISQWFQEFSEVKRYIDKQKLRVVTKGYVENIFGRKRRFFGTDPSTAEGRENQRQGVNATIQGGAGDLTKWVGTRIYWKMKKLKLPGKLIANVHDAVVIDCQENYSKEIGNILQEIAMNPPMELRVPLVMDIKIGKRWNELEEV